MSNLFNEPQDMRREALMSECGTYRYMLVRQWNHELPVLGWIMLNPSTANAFDDDPTIRRCMNFARSADHGGIFVTNLFALRSSDPAELRRSLSQIGPRNDEYLEAMPFSCARIMAAWGAHGGYLGRDKDVRALLRRRMWGRVFHLGLTKAGAPKHPLYLAATTQPIHWEDL